MWDVVYREGCGTEVGEWYREGLRGQAGGALAAVVAAGGEHGAAHRVHGARRCEAAQRVVYSCTALS